MLSPSEGQEGLAVRAHQPGGDKTPALGDIDARLLAGVLSMPLAELAEQHSLLVHDTDTGLIVHDGRGATVAANVAAERLLGLTIDELRGRLAGDPRWATVGRSGTALAPDEHPVMRAVESGESIRNAIIGLHRPTDD